MVERSKKGNFLLTHAAARIRLLGYFINLIYDTPSTAVPVTAFAISYHATGSCPLILIV
jgi:hypothetical protein